METPSNGSTTTRRQFFADASRKSGSAGMIAALLASVDRAAGIDAEIKSSYLDAEHVVILMQENRSFDHTFGTLRGVRGFNDPRAVTLPDQNPVWLQTSKAGETYAPFRLNIKETNATWLGSLPHSWRDQTDARNHGNHDRWLDSKPSSRPECAGMPFTLGYYNREDLPFYYALADAFTICDQNFCSSLTGTTPNRLYLWTGTIRASQDSAAPANVRNSDVEYDSTAKWHTFPERLEDAGVSWKIYQNEISLVSGLTGEEDGWLANFSDNPIEWFEQFNVQFSKTFQAYAKKAAITLPSEIADLDKRIAAAKGAESARLKREKAAKEKIQRLIAVAPKYSEEAFTKLSQRERNLHEKAFCSNAGDPAYRELTTLSYLDGKTERQMKIPKGDVLHQFRSDVETGKLPAVSWIVPPENFSDHPSAPWYGAWMVSEVLNILTHNPDVWKKTIFILTYDENDGYFDHVVPFTAPNPARPETGKTSGGIDASVEYWSLERDLERRPPSDARGSSIGLGFRVPMVVASPWSRGGFVCSQVFDHTSVLQLLERVISHKLGRELRETNISTWRRTVCGDLSSAFQPAASQPVANRLKFPPQEAVLKTIYNAKFKQPPSGYRKLSAEDIQQFRHDRSASSWAPQQEAGVRPSLPLPYELYAGGALNGARTALEISMEAGVRAFGQKSSGAPFHVYTPGQFRQQAELRTRAYAVEAGKRVTDVWSLDGFDGSRYHVSICGPNGFLRDLSGDASDPALEVRCEYARGDSAAQSTGDLNVVVTNKSSRDGYRLQITDHMYKGKDQVASLRPSEVKTIRLRLAKSFSWYDFTISLPAFPVFARRCAGRVETGRASVSDPVMGRLE